MINCILIQHQPGKPSPPLTCWTVLSPLTDWSFPMECKYVCDTAQSRLGPRQPNYVRRWQKMRGEKLQGLLGRVSQHHLDDELYSSTLTLTQISNWESLKCAALPNEMMQERRGESLVPCQYEPSLGPSLSRPGKIDARDRRVFSSLQHSGKHSPLLHCNVCFALPPLASSNIQPSWESDCGTVGPPSAVNQD